MNIKDKSKGKYIPKYVKRAIKINQFFNFKKKSLSRVECIKKFGGFGKEVNTTERALSYLVKKGELKKYYSNKGRVMFKK